MIIIAAYALVVAHPGGVFENSKRRPAKTDDDKADMTTTSV